MSLLTGPEMSPPVCGRGVTGTVKNGDKLLCNTLLPAGVHNLDRVVSFTHGTMILCVCLGSVVQCQNGGHYASLVAR